ncbi:sortase A [Pseudoalteromonas mariniglutinosa NCIMB 1770]|nr:sortase A [Pseudoalteromonas mariniglutinosa NCIMB 1770]
MLCLGLKNENSVWHRFINCRRGLVWPWKLYARQSMVGTTPYRAGLAKSTNNAKAAGKTMVLC